MQRFCKLNPVPQLAYRIELTLIKIDLYNTSIRMVQQLTTNQCYFGNLWPIIMSEW